MMEVQAQYIRLLAEVSMIRPVIQRQSWQHSKDRGHVELSMELREVVQCHKNLLTH